MQHTWPSPRPVHPVPWHACTAPRPPLLMNVQLPPAEAQTTLKMPSTHAAHLNMCTRSKRPARPLARDGLQSLLTEWHGGVNPAGTRTTAFTSNGAPRSFGTKVSSMNLLAFSCAWSELVHQLPKSHAKPTALGRIQHTLNACRLATAPHVSAIDSWIRVHNGSVVWSNPVVSWAI